MIIAVCDPKGIAIEAIKTILYHDKGLSDRISRIYEFWNMEQLLDASRDSSFDCIVFPNYCNSHNSVVCSLSCGYNRFPLVEHDPRYTLIVRDIHYWETARSLWTQYLKAIPGKEEKVKRAIRGILADYEKEERDIIYLESKNHCVLVHLDGIRQTPEGSPSFYATLDEAEHEFASSAFLRIHKSYLINGDHTADDTDTVITTVEVENRPNTYYLMLRDRSIYLTAVGTALKWSAYTGEEEQMFTILEPGTGSDGSDSGEVSNVPDSKLVTKFIPAYEGNYTKDRKAQGGTISEITIHHCASILTIDALGALWQSEGRKGSSHYGVSETNIGQYVHESDVAWTNGNWEANCRAVTIETSNGGGAPEWPVSDTTFQTLVTLVADIARRNGLGKLVKGKNLTWHSMYAATACPGPYLSGKLQELVDKANTINGF